MAERTTQEPEKTLREDINKVLKEKFGTTIDGLAMWRVVWSSDQYEKVLTKFTDAGIELLFPEVRELPKYREFTKDRYILEHLVVVPDISKAELPSVTMSYEPIHTFWDGTGAYMAPAIAPCVFIAETVHAAMDEARRGNGSMARYKQTTEEAAKASIDEYNDIYNGLYGAESGLGGAIVHKQGVAGFYPEGKATKLNKFGSKGHN
jgi:hypothetical protein